MLQNHLFISVIIAVITIAFMIKFKIVPFGLMVDGGGDSPEGDEGEKKDGEPKTYSEDVFKGVVKQRDELKGKVTDLTTKYDEMQAQLNKIKEDDLKAKGSIQELLDAKAKELDETKAKLAETETTLSAKTTELESIETETKKELLAHLTKEQKEFIKDKPVSEVRAFVKLVGESGGSDPDKGGKLNPKGDITLTDAQKKEAADMDLSPELYKQYLKDREERKPKK